MPKLKAQELMRTARLSVVTQHSGDASARLATDIGIVGLARLLALQSHLGEKPDASLWVGIDATPSRHEKRSAAGYVNGSRFKWSSTRPILPIGFLPNACGLAVAGLPGLPNADRTLARLLELVQSPVKVEGLEVKLDLARRNHFISVFEIGNNGSSFAFPYVAIIHSSAPELKGKVRHSENLMGLESFDQLIQSYITPVGRIDYLVDEAAMDFASNFYSIAKYSALRRRTLLRTVFPDCQVLSDRLHQGLSQLGDCVIGSQLQSSTGDDSNYVFLSGPDAPSFMFNLNVQEDLSLPVPHAGGSVLPFLSDGTVVPTADGCMLTLRTHTGNTIACADVVDMPFVYREDGFGHLIRTGLVEPASTHTLLPRQCFRV